MNKQQLKQLNQLSHGTLISHLGIEITDVGDDYLCGRMPVDIRTVQPNGLLHGGASATLAETLGSIAGALQVDQTNQTVVGVELSCSHVRKATSGFIYGKALAVKIGRTLQVWSIELKNDNSELVCISRLTVAVVNK